MQAVVPGVSQIPLEEATEGLGRRVLSQVRSATGCISQQLKALLGVSSSSKGHPQNYEINNKPLPVNEEAQHLSDVLQIPKEEPQNYEVNCTFSFMSGDEICSINIAKPVNKVRLSPLIRPRSGYLEIENLLISSSS